MVLTNKQSRCVTPNIPVVGQDLKVIGRLEPLSVIHAEDQSIIQALVLWRQKAMQSFFTQFTATPERTQNWLKNVILADKSRIFFLIYEKEKLVGHFGLRNISRADVELDNLIRGEETQEKGFIFYAELSLCHWLFQTLGLTKVYSLVMSDNHRIMALGSRIGWTVTKRSRMTTDIVGDTIRFILHDGEPVGTDEICCLRMELAKENFYNLHAFLLDHQAPPG